jgi:hypothetical protein
MNRAEFDELDEAEKRHFYECKQCGEMVDKRQLEDVIFQEDHVHRPDIPYGGSEPVDKATYGSTTLSRRFGKTHHISPLRKKLERLRMSDPEPMKSYEEWLIKAAQSRADNSPGGEKLSGVPNEQLIIILLLLENIDRPGLLETAKLLLSRVPVDEEELVRLAKRERVDFLLPQIKQ